MAKKRGLASNRGLDALLGSIKKEKLIAGNLADAHIAPTQDTQSQSVLVDNNEQKSTHKKTNALGSSQDTYTQNTNTQNLDAQNLNTQSNQTLPQPINATNESPKNTNLAIETPTKFNKVFQDVTVSAKHDSQQNAAVTHTTQTHLVEDSQLNLLHIDVNTLQRGKYQPRLDLGEETLQELATSIKQHGVMQPIVIRPLTNTQAKSGITHEIIAGERRWRAAQIAGLTHIPAIIRPMSDDLAIALALIENIQREDLSVMEQAVALQRFHDEFGMSHAQIADVVGKARTTVSNLLRLNQLHDDVKTHLNDGLMDMGHARALLSLSAAQQPMIARKIVNEQLTVRQTEQLVKEILDPKETKPNKELDFERLRLNQQLSEQLGAVVKVKGSSTGKGSIEIFFHNPEELQALLKQLQQEI